MTLAVKWGSTPEEGGMIYFDAVTAYVQNYSGKVTKHPIDGGGNITDHFIKDNPTITLTAVISGVSISNTRFSITDLQGNQAFNTRLPVTPVSVNSTDNSVLDKYIPSSISQFLSDQTPSVQMQSEREDLTEQVRSMLVNLMSGLIYNETTSQFDSNVEVVQLYEFDRSLLKRIINNLVMTKITFNEDAKSGYALYCNITFEQVTFVQLKKVAIPKNVADSQKNRASSKKSLGKCDGSVKDTDDPNNKDSENKKDGIDESVEDADPLRGANDNG